MPRAPGRPSCGRAPGSRCRTACRWPGSAAPTTTCRSGWTPAQGARFTDVDGFTYSDFNIADMSMFCGYAPEPVVRAVSDRMARGNQFLLPTEDAIVVSEELARRYRLPKWQYTLSASQANTEVIRVARVMTGRDKVLMFDGKYHGHFDQALVELDDDGRARARGARPAGRRDGPRRARAVQRPRRRSRQRWIAANIAVVMTEPAMTNNYGLVLPDDGFHDGLRAADPRDRHAARLRRDPHAGVRSGRPHRACGTSSRTS